MSTYVWQLVSDKCTHLQTKGKLNKIQRSSVWGVMKRQQLKKMDRDSVEEELQKDKLTF